MAIDRSLPNQLDLLHGEPILKRRREQIQFADYSESKVQPEFQNECNINTIVSRFKKTGILSHVRQVQGQYGDFCSGTDYQEMMNYIADANSMFFSLPASLRDRFQNSPADFLNFVQNPDNASEIAKLGLTIESPVKPPVGDLGANGGVSTPPSSPGEGE